MEIPSQIDEGVWLTDVYIRGNNIYYEATIENEIDPSDMSSSDLADMRALLIESLREEGLIILHKKELVKEGVRFNYIYKDSRGKEFAKITIESDEL